LLAAHDAPDSLFVKETVQAEGQPPEAVGVMIGRYKLLEALGEGGFGSVWLAEQKEPVRRKVALKVIKLGMDTKQVVARFEAERQALALMDHPNIAKVLDAGTTDSGRPYFVMELVRGIPITKFCDENKLATRERLDLFIKVCHAVQHAHQKGIIHRDLKPSNVLVTLHDPDRVGVPKVIDFGIAKATQQELTDKTIHTLFQQFIGTPAYVSPEQAEMSGLDVDTRSDIYSLGVLLYELLTGTTPFDGKELLASGLDEMRRVIREEEPKRPSTRLSTLGQVEASTLAKHRREKLPALVHLVRGDLDWIVMKCLEKDRARRYETANGLAADLKRFLVSEPIVARPPSTAYKISKFVRRNKLAVGAGLLVLLALVLGLGSATWMFLNERKTSRALLREQNRAREAELNRVFDRAMFAAMSGDPHAMEAALNEPEAKILSGGQIAVARGLLAMTSGQPEEAVKHLREATTALPNSVAARALLATTLLYAHSYEEHRVVLTQLADLKEQTPQDYLFKGQALALQDAHIGLPLLDEAVARAPYALAYTVRAEGRALLAGNTGRTNDIEAALEDIAAAKARSLSQKNVTLLVNSCLTHVVAAGIYRRAADTSRWTNHLAAADLDGRQLEIFSSNTHAAMWRIWQLEMADREEGPNGSFNYTQRLVAEQKVRHQQIQLRFGNALLRRGQPREALEAYSGFPFNGFIASMRLFALLELPERRSGFEAELSKAQARKQGDLIDLTAPLLLLYAGRKQEARAVAQNLANQTEYYDRLLPEDQGAVKYLAGRLAETSFVSTAQGDLGKLCLVHCLIGFQHLAENDRAGALEHFRQSVETRAFLGPPYSWSQVALAQLARHPTWPPAVSQKNETEERVNANR
jgi:serine/threonine protein kinase